MGDGRVTIELRSDEALVLSHWLERLQMAGLSRVVDDPTVWAPIHRIAETAEGNGPAAAVDPASRNRSMRRAPMAVS